MSNSKSDLGNAVNAANGKAVPPEFKVVKTTFDGITFDLALPARYDGIVPKEKYLLKAAYCGFTMGSISGHLDAADSLRKSLNKQIPSLVKEGIRMGRRGVSEPSRDDLFAEMVFTNIMATGRSLAMAEKIMTSLKKALASNTLINDLNSARGKTSAKVDAKTGKTVKSTTSTKTDSEKFVERIKSAFNFMEGETFRHLCLQIDSKLNEKGKGKYVSVYDGFINFLRQEGINVVVSEGKGKIVKDSSK